MDMTFLEAGIPLQKTFWKENNKIQSSNYPMVREFTSYTYELERGIEELYELVLHHAAQGHCLLKGNLTRELQRESRAGATAPHLLTRWICLDFDGISGVTSIKALLTQLGLYDFDHIVQYSSKMGVMPDKGLSVHVFFLLEEETLPASLKHWLKHLNFSNKKLKEQITLTRDKNQLRWPLDVSVCQNDKLLYIAPPKLNKGIEDSFEGERITFVKRKRSEIPLKALALDKITQSLIQTQQAEVLNALRQAEGLSERENKTKTYRSETVVASPDQATITGLKEERGFVYINLNGGDSWAYYHPVNNPHIIKNFKGEDAFATKDLLPDYYEAARERAKEYDREQKENTEKEAIARKRETYERSLEDAASQKEGVSVFVANDRVADCYYMIRYDHEKESLELSKTGARQKLVDFMAEHGEPEPDFIPNWDFGFEFSNPETFRPDLQWVNLYRQTTLLRDASRYFNELGGKAPRKKTKLPKLCERVIGHALGNDEQMVADFLNWLAYLFQKRQPPRSAWILQGRQGTGKGAIFNHILTPILGDEYCTPTSIQAMETQYNGWLKHSLMVMVDESKTDSITAEADVLEKMKVYVKEPKVQLREMRTDHKKKPIFASFIINSNHKNRAWILEETDRRFHVAPYQDAFLDLDERDLEALEEELPEFLKHLMELKVNEKVAVTPRDTEHRELMKHVSRTAIDEVIKQLWAGNMEFFLEQAPRDVRVAMHDPSKSAQVMAFVQFMDEVVLWDESDKATAFRIHRDTLRTILDYIIGNMPDSPNKFTSMMKHHDVLWKTMKFNGVNGPGIEIVPIVTPGFAAEWVAYKDGPTVEAAKVNSKVTSIRKRK
jgi:hypothetical protein